MNKVMSKYLSRKIKFISVFAMFAIVFVNAYNYEKPLTPVSTIESGFNFFQMTEYFFSNGLFTFAVPLFFIISGFLFFLKYENTVKGYFNKLIKRCYPLLVPYVAWAIISGAAILILNNFGKFRFITFFKENLVPLDRCFIYLIKPPAFQLWFLRQLMLFAVLSPIIYLLVKYTKSLILIPFGILWICDVNFIISSQGLFFFSIGAAFAIFGKARNVTRRDNTPLAICFCTAWLLLSFSLTMLAAGKSNLWILMQIVYKLNEAVGVVGIWFMFDHIVKLITHKKGMLLASSHLFFVFALHEPLLHISNQMALIPDNSHSSHLILYICLPISVISVCIIISMMMRKVLRPLHSVLTGGRNN